MHSPVAFDRLIDRAAGESALRLAKETPGGRRHRLARASGGEAALDPGELEPAVADLPGRLDRKHRGIVQLGHRVSVRKSVRERFGELEARTFLTGEIQDLDSESDVTQALRLTSAEPGHMRDDVGRARVRTFAAT